MHSAETVSRCKLHPHRPFRIAYLTFKARDCCGAWDIKSGVNLHGRSVWLGVHGVQSLIFPDGTDVVLGFDKLEGYLDEHPYFGGIIGRVANRIGGASFEIDGTYYEIPANEGPNNLHSGPEGFDRVNWFGEIDGETLILRHTSPDGHQGFPGELQTELRFTFEGSKLSLQIEATVNKPCPVNITWHPYFNLTDGGKSPCVDHQLQISPTSLYWRVHCETHR